MHFAILYSLHKKATVRHQCEIANHCNVEISQQVAAVFQSCVRGFEGGRQYFLAQIVQT